MTTPQPTWTTSSFCSVGTCVSVTHSGDTVMVRHSAHPDGTTLTFSREEWVEFLAGVRAGEFDITPADGVGAVTPADPATDLRALQRAAVDVLDALDLIGELGEDDAVVGRLRDALSSPAPGRKDSPPPVETADARAEIAVVIVEEMVRGDLCDRGDLNASDVAAGAAAVIAARPDLFRALLSSGEQ